VTDQLHDFAFAGRQAESTIPAETEVPPRVRRTTDRRAARAKLS
jgi:hypothetical protein